MAIPTATGDLIQVNIESLQFNQVNINTLFWGIGTITGAAPSGEDLYDAMNTKFAGVGELYDKYIAATPDSLFGTLTRFQTIKPQRYVSRTYPSTIQGNLATGNQTNLAAVITRRAVLAGRRYIGGVHIPLPDSNAVAVSGVLTNVYKTVLAALSLKMFQAFNLPVGGSTVDLFPLIYHRGTGGYSDVNDAIVQPTVRVMRRRTVGVGI